MALVASKIEHQVKYAFLCRARGIVVLTSKRRHNRKISGLVVVLKGADADRGACEVGAVDIGGGIPEHKFKVLAAGAALRDDACSRRGRVFEYNGPGVPVGELDVRVCVLESCRVDDGPVEADGYVLSLAKEVEGKLKSTPRLEKALGYDLRRTMGLNHKLRLVDVLDILAESTGHKIDVALDVLGIYVHLEQLWGGFVGGF